MTVGSLLSALIASPVQLAACRIGTGLGVGAVISLSTSLAAEFSSARSRPFIVAITAQGFPAGNIIGGIAAAALLPTAGWQSVFVAGCLAGFVLLILLNLLLVESPSYLRARATPEALTRLGRVSAPLGHETPIVLPMQSSAERTSLGALFERDMAGLTVRLTLINVLSVMATAAAFFGSFLSPSTGLFYASWLTHFRLCRGLRELAWCLVSVVSRVQLGRRSSD